MTHSVDLDRALATWFDDETSLPAPAELLDHVLAATSSRRPRPTWVAALSAAQPTRSASRAILAALLALMIVVAVGFAVYVGSRIVTLHHAGLEGVIERTGGMVQSLYLPHATLLLDGNALVTGTASDGTVQAELYRSATGTFTSAAQLGIGRGDVRGGQIRLSDGSILVLGYRYLPEKASPGFAVRYDPSTMSFRQVGAEPMGGAFIWNDPHTILPDGRVRWEAPDPRVDVFFDPSSMSFRTPTKRYQKGRPGFFTEQTRDSPQPARAPTPPRPCQGGQTMSLRTTYRALIALVAVIHRRMQRRGRGIGKTNADLGAYSPDGRWLVFRLEKDGLFGLYRMRPDGSHVRQILPLSSFRPSLIDWGGRPPDD